MASTTADVAAQDMPFDDSAEILQFHTPGLGDNSYLLASEGEAVVIDPQRDISRFRDAVARRGVRLVAVIETHVHNDYVSGGPALAAERAVDYVVPAEAGYEMRHRTIRDGEELAVGGVRLRALHTPGHTPHHMSYTVVKDGEVRAVFSGGSVLVGACGRTDLIAPELAEPLTRSQYRSAQRIRSLPDPTLIGPTHGGGSFCASSLVDAERWTTVAAERERNPAFLARNEDDFVRTQLAGLPAHPTYYAHMGAINRRGASAWEAGPLPRLTLEALERLRGDGAVLVDARPRRDFAALHIPGSVSVELDPQFATYLGWLYPFGTRFALVLGADQDPGELQRQTGRIGMDTVIGLVTIEDWIQSGRPTEGIEVTDADGLRQAVMRGDAVVLDVRQDYEWRAGHVPGALHIHVPDLPPRVGELPPDRPVYCYCQSGYRTAMAASILAAAGRRAVLVDGGFPDWKERGYPVELGP